MMSEQEKLSNNPDKLLAALPGEDWQKEGGAIEIAKDYTVFKRLHDAEELFRSFVWHDDRFTVDWKLKEVFKVKENSYKYLIYFYSRPKYFPLVATTGNKNNSPLNKESLLNTIQNTRELISESFSAMEKDCIDMLKGEYDD